MLVAWNLFPPSAGPIDPLLLVSLLSRIEATSKVLLTDWLNPTDGTSALQRQRNRTADIFAFWNLQRRAFEKIIIL